MTNCDGMKCFLFEGCPGRTGACYACGPDDDGCPVYRWFKEKLLKEQSQLISVKDKLPGIDKDALFLYESKTSDKTGYIVISLKDFFSEQWQYFREDNVITHWMPLPEQPAEVKQDD